MDRSYEELKNAVVVQAVIDYRKSSKAAIRLKRLMMSEKNPDRYERYHLEYQRRCAMMKEVERFLLSDYGSLFLGEISGPWLLDQLRKE